MLRTVTPATVEPVTLAEVKAHLRVTHAADDALLSSQIKAAREYVEMHTGLALAAAGYAWYPGVAGYGGWRPMLPLWPATVTEVSYYNGVSRVVAPVADYRFDTDRGEVTLGSYTDPSVLFTTVPAPVPEALKSAIKLRVQAEYEAEPEDSDSLRHAANMVSYPWRRGLGV